MDILADKEDEVAIGSQIADCAGPIDVLKELIGRKRRRQFELWMINQVTREVHRDPAAFRHSSGVSDIAHELTTLKQVREYEPGG